MKRKLLVLFYLLVSAVGLSQVCSGNLTLRTQADVVALGNNICQTYDGNIFIFSEPATGTDPIVDLSPLENINIITGALQIIGNTFSNLNGLQNLTAIGPQGNESFGTITLVIQDNPNLISIQSLSGLNGDLLDLYVNNNPQLQSLQGLQNLKEIYKTIQIKDNLVLQNLDGLIGLTGTTTFTGATNVEISNNSQLTNLNGLGNWTRQFSRLDIIDNAQLSEIKGLSEISSFGSAGIDQYTISGNTSLTEFCGLHKFASTAVDNALTLTNNGIAITQQQIVANGSCYTLIPDLKFENALIEKGFDSEGSPANGKILTRDIENATFLNLTGNPGTQPETNPNNIIRLDIEDLTGIEGFTSLQTLFIQGNDLTTVNLSNNLELIDVRAFNNDVLQSINIDGLDKLKIIGLNNNQISSIDVSTNIGLETFDIANNNLSTLDIQNLNALTGINVQGNPQLTCILVENAAIASNYNNDTDNFKKDGSATFSENCNPVYDVEVDVSSAREQDANGFFVVRSANDPIVLQFNAVDENGQDLNASQLQDYDLTITTFPDPNRNPAAGGNTTTPGIDFELLNGLNQNVLVQNGQVDFTRAIQMQEDQLFEADEYFVIEVSSTDPAIKLKSAVSGVVQIPVRIIDNSQTNIILELVNNGMEPNQNARLRITSSSQNDTGAPMPFNLSLSGGSAVLGEDYQDLAVQPTIPNGASSTEFDIVILNNDAVPENEENFFANMSYAGNLNDDSQRVIIQDGTEEITITEDTSTTPGITVSKSTVTTSEPNIEDSFTVVLDTQPANEVVINIVSNDVGEATVDPATFTFTNTDWNQPQTVTVTGQDDSFEDGTQNYELNILVDDALSDDDYDNVGDLIVSGVNNDNDDFSSTPANLRAELKGDVQIDGDGNYSIEEGKTIEVWIEATNADEINGQSFSFNYSVSTTGEPEDYAIISTNPTYEFTVDDNVNPDGKLIIDINLDSFNDADELIDITLDGLFTNWEDGFFDEDSGSIKLKMPTIEIINVTTAETSIVAEIDNSGGTEGNGEENGVGTDTFTLVLKNKDGTLHIAEEELEFPINFTPDLNVSEELRAEIETDLGQPLPNKIIIPAGSSSGSIVINLPQEMEMDDNHEFYIVSLEPPNPTTGVDLPEPFQAKIIDDEGSFQVNAIIMTTDQEIDAYRGNTIFINDACCPWYTVEEGDNFRIALEAEKGVLLGTEFKVKINYSSGNSFSPDPDADKDADFINVDSRLTDPTTEEERLDAEQDIFAYSAKPNANPDNILIHSIVDDGDPEGPEEFYISLTSTDQSKFKVSAFGSIKILEAIPLTIDATDKNASEFPLDKARFTLTLDEINNTGNPIRVFYEIDPQSQAESGKDFVPLVGYVEIPDGAMTAEIEIEPINDRDVEDPETVFIKLIDRAGYSIKGSGVESITITSDDIALVTATLKTTDELAREIDPTDTGIFTIELDKINPNNEDTIINFEVLIGLSTDAENGEYELLDKNLAPIGNTNQVTIEQGETSTFIFVRAKNDNIDEIDENVRLKLLPGTNYSIGTPNQDFVKIKSSTFDTDSFDPRSIKVTAQSAICASKDLGGILVENGSDFEFAVTLTKVGDENFTEIIKDLNADIPLTIADLRTGTYNLILQNLTNPDLASPGFTVQIQKQEVITADIEGVDLKTKTGKLIVSGSTSYTVSTKSKTYTYKFESISPRTIVVPLEAGLNSISVEGLATCQGKINAEMFIDTAYIYPNPTQDVFHIVGFEIGENIRIQIADASGKVIYQEQNVIRENILSISLLNFQAGIYLGEVTSSTGSTINFKIVKEN